MKISGIIILSTLIMSAVQAQEKYNEFYRPQFHFSPASGWIGDPNGLVRYNNKYHLFWWGHTISEDLVYWNEKSWPMHGDHSTFDYFSGSAVVDKKNTGGFQTGAYPPMIAIFTNHNPTTELEAPALSICNEYTSDYTNFYLYNNGEPIMPTATGFRDPSVFWDNANNQWIMAIAKSGSSSVMFFRSTNLKSWELLNSFRSSVLRGWWECPDLFQLPIDGNSNNKRWVLIIGTNGKTQYFLGDFDGRSGFQVDPAYDANLIVDHGSDFYATRTFRDYDHVEDRTVCMAWMSNWLYANSTPTSWGRGHQSLPRELSLKTYPEGIRLIQQPIPELKKLRTDSTFIADKSILDVQKITEFTPDFNYYELEATFEVSEGNNFGLNLCVNGNLKVIVGYDVVNSRLYLDRRKSGDVSFSTDFPNIVYAPLTPENGQIKLHIFVDQSSIEVFANDGKCAISSLIFPHYSSKTIQIFSNNGTTFLKSLKAYNLKSIWKTYATSEVIIPADKYNIDHVKKIILVNEDVDLINSTYPGSKEKIRLDRDYSFITPLNNIEIGKEYLVKPVSYNIDYKLYFTQLPVINIKTSNRITEDPLVLANFKMVESNGKTVTSNIGIKYRGVSTLAFPKKSMRIEFWTDDAGKITRDVSLLGMRSDDDWNLQAMYNEPMRLRSKTSNELWMKIYTPYYQLLEPDAVNGVHMEYAELFLNGQYRGVYCVSERLDRKQLKLKKYNGNIRGELYQCKHWDDNVLFEGLSDYDNNNIIWGGFEYKHPEELINWNNLYEFVRFVVSSDNTKFQQEYKERFDLKNAVDYYIFLNLLRAPDNRAKNTYIGRYNVNEPYFYIPWDLDGVFGTVWDGSRVNVYNDLLSNGFYDRANKDHSENGFVCQSERRWQELRKNVITHPNIINMFQENYKYLENNGIYEREKMAWSEFDKNTEDHFTYLSAWLQNRLKYLDGIFNYDPDNPISKNTITSEKVKIYPVLVTDYFCVELNSDKSANICIFDIQGNMIRKEKITSSDNQISVSNLNNGMYIVRVFNEETNEIKKIIVRK